jgi:hypothetical protein
VGSRWLLTLKNQCGNSVPKPRRGHSLQEEGRGRKPRRGPNPPQRAAGPGARARRGANPLPPETDASNQLPRGLLGGGAGWAEPRGCKESGQAERRPGRAAATGAQAAARGAGGPGARAAAGGLCGAGRRRRAPWQRGRGGEGGGKVERNVVGKVEAGGGSGGDRGAWKESRAVLQALEEGPQGAPPAAVQYERMGEVCAAWEGASGGVAGGAAVGAATRRLVKEREIRRLAVASFSSAPSAALPMGACRALKRGRVAAGQAQGPQGRRVPGQRHGGGAGEMPGGGAWGVVAILSTGG